MKTIAVPFFFIPFCTLGQGTDCASATNVPLDGTIRTYSTSSTTGSNVLCSGTGTSPVSWFKFTTDASAACPLFAIEVSDNSVCEVALYTSCTGNMTNNLEINSSMCFEDGKGLWAPAENYYLEGNKTYYLRIKTTSASTIKLSGKPNTPINDDCTGAMAVDETQRTDNNACHKGGPGVFPAQLCASTLENTAFYYYYVASTGATIINISNIACDNGAGNNRNGFQIGFFTGSCNNFTYLSCDSGSGNFVQATTQILPADTKVYVAIDGFSGSNCAYTIQALNAYSVLDINLDHFSAWKQGSSNVLKWQSEVGSKAQFDIERSGDGSNFKTIGTIHSLKNKTETNYEFFDNAPLQKSFYRLKIKSIDANIFLSEVIKVAREDLPQISLQLQNPANSIVKGQVYIPNPGFYSITVRNLWGQVFTIRKAHFNKGYNNVHVDVSSYPNGKYVFTIEKGELYSSQKFLKLN